MEHLVPARWQWHALLATLGSPVQGHKHGSSMAQGRRDWLKPKEVHKWLGPRRCQAPKTSKNQLDIVWGSHDFDPPKATPKFLAKRHASLVQSVLWRTVDHCF